MHIIDSHAHISLNGRNDKSAEHLLAAMDEAGIARALVFAATIADLPTETVLADIAPYADRMHAIAAVSPFKKAHRPPLRVMEEWLKSGAVRGIKFYTGYEHFYPADKRIRPYLRLLEKYGRPAIFHSGDTYDRVGHAKLKYAHPLHVDDLAAEMPGLKIVIAHLGSPWVVDCAQVVYKNDNVYADCSGFVYKTFSPARRAYFKELWRQFDLVTESSGKILFGSDWPISEIGPYVKVVRSVAGKHAERVFHGNAEELFGL